MEETKRCPMCGEEILAVAKKCRFCGEYLEQEKPEQVSRKNKIVAAIAVLVILGVTAAVCFSLADKRLGGIACGACFCGSGQYSSFSLYHLKNMYHRP